MRIQILFLLIPFSIFSQIGINNTTPAATLDITAKKSTGIGVESDGMIIPRVDRQRAQNMIAIPISTLIYISSIGTGTQTGNAININTTGLYYYNGTAWIKIAIGENINIYNGNNSLTAERNINLAGNNLTFTEMGNVGFGVLVPTAKLEIASTITDISGLKFSNINNATATSENVASLGIDNNGNVVIQNNRPVTTSFKSFNINANTSANSLISLGNLQFRATATSCPVSGVSYLQIRSKSGSNNIGISHAQYRTAQNGAVFVSTEPLTITSNFTDIIPLRLACYQDGHGQLSFYSYTDKTYYRISINVSDGDGLGFGGQGYIFAEIQQ